MRYNYKDKRFERSSEWIKTSEAAKVLGVSQNTVKRYCREGKIEAKKPGGNWLIKRDELRGQI